MDLLIKKINDYNVSLLFALFFCTLVSFYQYEYNLNFAYLISLFLFLLLAIKKIKNLNYSNIKKINLFFKLIIFLGILNLFVYLINHPVISLGNFQNSKSVLNNDVSLTFEKKFFFKYLFLIISIYAIGISLIKKNIKNLLSIIILFHSAFLILQVIFFYGFNIQIDFLEYFMGEESKGAHHQFIIGEMNWHNIISLKRFSGLFNEPGTFANVLALLACCLTNYKNLNKFNYIALIFVLLGLLLTFSLYAYLFLIIIIFSYFINNKNNLINIISKNKKFLLVISILISIIVIKFTYPYFSQRFFLGNYSGIEFRLAAYINYISSLAFDPLILLFGTGVFNEKLAFLLTGITYDNTLFFYLISRFGILIFYLFLLLFLLLLKNDKSKLCTFIILCLTKISFFSPLIVFVFCFLFTNPIDNND